jgi:hypothetical protein
MCHYSVGSHHIREKERENVRERGRGEEIEGEGGMKTTQ